MDDYRKMYAILFNAVTDAVNLLQEAQRQTEALAMADTHNLLEYPQENETH